MNQSCTQPTWEISDLQRVAGTYLPQNPPLSEIWASRQLYSVVAESHIDYQRVGTTKISYTFNTICNKEDVWPISPKGVDPAVNMSLPPQRDQAYKGEPRLIEPFEYKSCISYEYTAYDIGDDHCASTCAKVYEEYRKAFSVKAYWYCKHVSTMISFNEAIKMISQAKQIDKIISTHKNMVSLTCVGESSYKYMDLVTEDESTDHDGTNYDDSEGSDYDGSDDSDHDGSEGSDYDGSEGTGKIISTFLGDLRSPEGHRKSSFIPSSIESLQNLIELDLHDIPLITLPESITKLQSLTNISIKQCFLVSFPESICFVQHLKYLYIEDCNISTLPESIGYLTELHVLTVEDNNLSSLPESFSKLTQLQHINMDGNNLSSLPESFSNLTQLQRLNISNNNLLSLPESISTLTQLQHIVIDHNNLLSLPDWINNFDRLNLLYISNNNITSLPESIGELKNLGMFKFDNNSIARLPDSISMLTNLLLLSCMNNQLESLPESIGYFTDLAYLYLNDNKLLTLPQSIGKLCNLSYITLHNNPFISLPESIFNITVSAINLSYNSLTTFDLPAQINVQFIERLTNLNLSHSNLVSLPYAIGNLLNLTTFDCSYNNLTSIPDSIGNLTKIYTLACSHNNITILPESVTELKSLDELDCGYNKLSELPWTIHKLKELRKLKCSSNRLRYLPIQLYFCRNLVRIFFSGNPIEFIPEPLVRKLYELSQDNYNDRFRGSKETLPLPAHVVTSLIDLMNSFPIDSRKPLSYAYKPYNIEKCTEEHDQTNINHRCGCSDWSDLRVYQEMSDDDMFEVLKTCPYITDDFLLPSGSLRDPKKVDDLRCNSLDPKDPKRVDNLRFNLLGRSEISRMSEGVINLLDSLIHKKITRTYPPQNPSLSEILASRHPIYVLTFKEVLKRVTQRIKSIENGDLQRVIYTRLSEMIILAYSQFDSFDNNPITLSSRNPDDADHISPKGVDHAVISRDTILYHRLNELFTRLIDTISPMI